MLKKFLFACIFFLLPLGARASCDLSVKHMAALSQNDLDAVYARYPMRFGKPTLIVNDKNVRTYYADEYKGIITIYPKSFSDSYCDQYFDGLSTSVAEVVSHEYTHFLDEKMQLSKKIGEKDMSEKTADLGEHVFNELVWHNQYFVNNFSQSDLKKYNTFVRILQTSAV